MATSRLQVIGIEQTRGTGALNGVIRTHWFAPAEQPTRQFTADPAVLELLVESYA